MEQIGLFKTQKNDKPLWCDINLAWGIAPGNPSYAHVESNWLVSPQFWPLLPITD
jgi:hypothetical protein